MLKRLFDKIKNIAWKVSAFIIVMIIIGPELLVGVELMSLVNLIGADVFVITTFASFITFTLKPIFHKLVKFEEKTNFYIPTIEMITKNPTSLFYLLPTRTLTYVLFLLAFFIFVIETIPYWITLF